MTMIALYSLVSLAILAWLVLGPLNQHRVDRLRQDLFAMRDRLFMDAAQGKIRFDSTAYGYTRVTMNGMLRFAHRLSLARCLTIMALIDDADIRASRAHQERLLAAASSEDRELCLQYLTEANERLFLHVLSSPFALMLLVPVVTTAATFVTGVNCASWGVRKCRDAFSKLDALAFEEGQTTLASNHQLASQAASVSC